MDNFPSKATSSAQWCNALGYLIYNPVRQEYRCPYCGAAVVTRAETARLGTKDAVAGVVMAHPCISGKKS